MTSRSDPRRGAEGDDAGAGESNDSGFLGGKKSDEGWKAKAQKENIPMMVSDLPAFEAIGKVYNLIAEKKKAAAP